MENLPRDGGYVLAAGHVSNLDPWALGLAIWPRRFLRFMGKSELFWFPLSLVLAGVGAFKVHRGRADREAIETAVNLAREGNVIAMFPEGTRRRKGLRKKYEAGAHKGTDGLSRLAPWRVQYGAPIDIDDLRGQEIGEAARTATDRLMVEIHKLEESL